jgi:cell division protein FtsZ
MPQRRERMLQGTAALPASRMEPMAPPPPPRIAQRPAATPAPAFASEIYASAEEHELPVDVQEKPVARKKGRQEQQEKSSAAPVPEPVAVQPPPPPPPAPAPVARAEEPLRVTPPSQPLRVTPSEPLRVPNEPLRITPLREPEPLQERVPERVHGAYVPAASAEPKPELIAVPASVFDDDFFRKPNEDLRTPPEPRRWDNDSRVLEPVAAPEKTQTHWPEAKVPSFAGYAGGSSSSSEEDELDIPAFLRRSR